ncbi:MAG: PAS domain S-box protein, partial [Verrucomicrobia bacterium]|nr:PAS domain S-box protein [Verrucomicrobiota bacterium]
MSDNKSIFFSAAQLAAIVESSQDAIVGEDLKSAVTIWNRGAEQIFGYSAAEMIGQSVRVLIPPDRQHEEDEFLASVGRSEPVKHFETVRRRKDGRLIDVAITVSPIRDLLGRVTGMSKIARDITEHMGVVDEIHRLKDVLEERVRERTAELRQNEEMLRSITDHTDDFVFIKDGEGRFVFANPALCRANGRTLEQMRGRTAAELNPDAAEVERFTAEDRQVLAGRRALTVEESRTIRGTGERQTLLTIKSPRLDAGGKVIGLIGISHDITERKRAEEALHHSEMLFHSVWDKSADGMRLTDKDGVIVAVNEAYCQLTGRRAEERVGRPFTVSYPGDD